MEIDDVFDALVGVLTRVIHWSQVNGIFFRGTFYSFFNIEIAGMVAAIILTNLPIWRDSFDGVKSIHDFDDVDYYDD